MVRKHFKESLHPGYHDMWTFTDPKTNKQVDKMSWISIKYHKCIKYKATPYDSEYDEYFERRLFKKNLLCSFLVNFIDNDFSYLHNIVIYLSL